MLAYLASADLIIWKAEKNPHVWIIVHKVRIWEWFWKNIEL